MRFLSVPRRCSVGIELISLEGRSKLAPVDARDDRSWQTWRAGLQVFGNNYNTGREKREVVVRGGGVSCRLLMALSC